MAKPRKSTRDEFIDQFDSFDLESQESVLDNLELVHRLAKKRAVKDKTTTPAEVPAAGEQLQLREPAE